MTAKRTRMGADEVRAWVRRLTLCNPYAKAILMAAANYANENAIAWPGVSTLAADTDIAKNTVSARLKWCEQIGAIMLVPAYVDENGHRTHDPRGRPTSSDIRFMIDVDPQAISGNAERLSKPRPLRGVARKAREAAAASFPRHEEQTPMLDLGVCSSVAPQQPPTPGPRSRELEEGSEAKASGAPAPSPAVYSDARHALFGEGVPILESLGVKERQARSMIGRWLKDTRDDAAAVLGAIQRAREHRAQDPIPWITQGLKVRNDEQIASQAGKPKPGSFFAGIAKVAATLDRDSRVAGSAETDIPPGRINIDG